jgi:hypothetical protein
LDNSRRGEGKWRGWWMYFVYVYENRTTKPDEIVLRRGGERWRG